MCTWQEGDLVFGRASKPRILYFYFWCRDSRDLFVSDSWCYKIQTPTRFIMFFEPIFVKVKNFCNFLTFLNTKKFKFKNKWNTWLFKRWSKMSFEQHVAKKVWQIKKIYVKLFARSRSKLIFNHLLESQVFKKKVYWPLLFTPID